VRVHVRVRVRVRVHVRVLCCRFIVGVCGGRWCRPGMIAPNSWSGEIVSSLDVFPTLANVTGAAMPTDRPYDGKNMVRVLYLFFLFKTALQRRWSWAVVVCVWVGGHTFSNRLCVRRCRFFCRRFPAVDAAAGAPRAAVPVAQQFPVPIQRPLQRRCAVRGAVR
jgi:hypothetical protein